MSDIEEGEISSGDEESDVNPDDPPYNPLDRPQYPQNQSGSRSPTLMNLPSAPRPGSSTNSSMMVNIGDMEGGEDGDVELGSGSLLENSMSCSSSEKTRVQEVDDSDDEDGLIESSSEDNSSADDAKTGVQKPRRKKVLRLVGNRNDNNIVNEKLGGGSVFNSLAMKYQEDRARQGLPTTRKQNNIWGSILQEESLTTELTSIGVGRTLKDLGSDRGAETYDFVLAQEHEASRRDEREKKDREREEQDLNQELSEYWAKSQNVDEEDKMETGNVEIRRGNAIQAGKKRSVKNRVGSRIHRRDRRICSQDMDEMSIPPPGVSRTIPNLTAETLTLSSDEEFGRDVANMLSEPKTQLMVGVVQIVGREVAVELFAQTQQVEENGGMMIKNGERRRTPGGVFLQLLRDNAPNDSRIDEQKIKHFFAQSNRQPQKRKRNQGPYNSELDYFRKLSHQRKEKEKNDEASRSEMDVEGDNAVEELKPLPDILSCIASKMTDGRQSSNRSNSCDSNSLSLNKGDDKDARALKSFIEPDAPPNSVERVERTLSSYDDDIIGIDASDFDLF